MRKNIELKKLLVFALALSLVLSMSALLTGCASGSGDGAENQTTSGSESGVDEDDVLGSMNEMLRGHDVDVSESPVAGSYTTTSGCKVELGEDGSYRWEEPDGVFLKGSYELFEGTPVGGGEYVTESETGAIYTVVVYYDLVEEANLEEKQVIPASDVSVFVYDTYDKDVFRVSDLMNDIQFEATRD
ncbi:MAG: hypothetical protein LBN34_00855 [Clostridiales Family XIII bacterium]|jgi:hypothetical protein|nr:hypothetical protein [Clostridiales Family XIII bacterium]